MKKLAIIAFTTAALLAVGPVFAQDDAPKDGKGQRGPRGPRPEPGKIFEKIDADNSGDIDLEEFTDAAAKRAEEAFKKMDKDGNGELTKEEFRPPHRGRGPGKHRGGKPCEGKPGEEAGDDAAAE